MKPAVAVYGVIMFMERINTLAHPVPTGGFYCSNQRDRKLFYQLIMHTDNPHQPMFVLDTVEPHATDNAYCPGKKQNS